MVTIINRKLMAMHIMCRHQKVMNATTDPVSIPQENHNMYTALTPVPLVTIDRAVMSVAPLSTLPQNCPEYCSSTSLELGDVLPQYLRQFWGKAVLHFCCSIVRCPLAMHTCSKVTAVIPILSETCSIRTEVPKNLSASSTRGTL